MAAVHRRWLVLAALLVVVVVSAALVVRAVDRNRRSRPSPAGPSVPSRAVPGFDEVAFRVHGSAVSGTVSKLKHCALLAKTESQRELGLMNRRDLGGYEGMVFEFPQPGRVPFYMKDTIVALSIAWFDASGRFVNATDMNPCPPGGDCPRYYPAAPATLAIEVEQGHLSALGIGPGTTMSVGGPCVT
jgi:uncharacterized membrane protein (UPF0127 family)